MRRAVAVTAVMLAATASLAGQNGSRSAQNIDMARVLANRGREVVFTFVPTRVLEHDAALKISAAQRAELVHAVDHTRRAFQPLVERLADAQAALEDALRPVPIGEADALAAFDRVLQLEAELKRLQLRLHLHTYNLLTQDQRTTFLRLETSQR